MDMPNQFDQADILVIRDPEIDQDEVWHQVRQSLAEREELPPLAASLGTARMRQKRAKLTKTLKDLQEKMRDYGIVESHRTGWRAAVELFIKKTLRKVVLRHILQQQRVHLKLHNLLNQVVQYLEEQDQCFRACIDLSDRRHEEHDWAVHPESSKGVECSSGQPRTR
jgi:hypothetical protein